MQAAAASANSAVISARHWSGFMAWQRHEV